MDSQDIEQLEVLFNSSLDRKNFPQANSFLQRMLALDPNSTLVLLAELQYEIDVKNFERAFELVKKVLLKDPHNLKARAHLADLHHQSKNLAEAEKILLEIIRDYPANDDFIAIYAHYLAEALQFTKADAVADHALKLNFQNSTALWVKILCKVSRGELSTLQNDVERIYSIDPTSIDFGWKLALILANNLHYKEAYNLARELYKKDPQDKDALEALIEMKVRSHPLVWPLYPILRWGSFASITIWIGYLTALVLLYKLGLPQVLFAPLIFLYVLYVIGSWICIPLLTKWYQWKGISS